MRLKRVELIGFKSFMDKTVLNFRDGITTILGPNGCGKSNVVDAVRWVLGEQRAKQLRGEKMDDVIFKGSGRRRPLSVAEVSLVFDNSEGRLPVEYDEVSIGRRVERTGHSDYFLNRTPCRLKDIRDLFYDTGVGNNAYSVIEQEVVGQVLDPNENKVRTILEEGSGIVRYKVKRKEALRKLDLTERDLLRVEDIIEEIGKQVRSLARQVGKARRHQKLHGEVRGLEVLRAHAELAGIDARLKELAERSEALRSEGTGEDAKIARLRAELEQMRPGLDALEERRRERAHELSKVEAEASRLEGELLVLREKVEAGTRRREEIAGESERSEARLAEVRAEIDSAETERSEVDARLAERRAKGQDFERAAEEAARRHDQSRKALAEAQQMTMGFLREEAAQKSEIKAAQSRFATLQEREEALQTRLRSADEELGSARTRVAAAREHAEAMRRRVEDETKSLEAAKTEAERAEEHWNQERERRSAAADELARAESRHELAERLASEYEGYRAGAAALLGDGRVRGAIAEQLRVDAGYESAFELVFGEDADALILDGLEDVAELSDRLRTDALGRASFVAGGLRASELHREDANLPGRRAMDLVRVEGAARDRAEQWLRQVRVVESSREAIDAALAHAGHGLDFLAREGLFIRHDGLVRAGAGEQRALSLFGRREQVDELAAGVERLAAVLREREAAVDSTLRARDEARRAVESAESVLERARGESQNAEKEAATLASVLQRDEQSRGELAQQHEETREALAGLVSDIERLEHGLGLHGEDQATSEARVESLNAQVARDEAAREQTAAALAEARLELTRDEGHARELSSRFDRLAAMRDDLQQRLGRLAEEDHRLETDVAGWKKSREEGQARLTELFDDRDQQREGVRSVQDEIEAKRQEAERVQQTMSELSDAQRKKEQALHELETESTKLNLTADNLRDRLREKFQLEVEAAYAQLDAASLPRDLVLGEDGVYQLSQVKELLAERREKLDKLGPVNFVALDEYDAKKTRLEFLEKQRDDLLSSKEDLLQAIDRINRTARQLFRDTFEQVRANFQQIFATLFEGGTADLLLHKTDDPLESDVQIIAQPSGKKVDSVSLLSGGERALTAISLLFSVYLIKPSPFCLLDEVDAPLDDVNVGRFVRLLKGFADRTQFIVITHNKLTMEAADHLYGVTMAEKGVSRLVSVSFDDIDAEDPMAALEDVAKKENERPAAKLASVHEILDESDGEGENGNGKALAVEPTLEAEG